MLNFLGKKQKIQKNPALAAAGAWKFLKFSLHRRRRGCIYFVLAATQKFLKFSSPRRQRLYFLRENRRRRRLSRSAYTSNHNICFIACVFELLTKVRFVQVNPNKYKTATLEYVYQRKRISIENSKATVYYIFLHDE
jgi:hypothetical protein